MNTLILGSGGREHAFAWRISQSTLCDKLFVAPGNAGTAQIATNLPISYNDFEKIAEAVLTNGIELVIVGPEEPLVKGVRDYFQSREDLKHVLMVGPDAHGAMLEGSKDFSKNFMVKYGVPTAKSQTFTKDTLEDGLKYLENQKLPIVLKADGLAAGKGVIIALSLDEAKEALTEMLVDAKFGDASSKVVIEEFLTGIELSVFVLTDGDSYKVLPEAKDYKRIGEGDTGLNTGGMGAVSPVPFATAKFMEAVDTQVIKPTLAGLKAEGIKYNGFIFIGLMNHEGEPYVIEYNARMGDPETEVVLPRIESDFLALMIATAKNELHEADFTVSKQHAVTTVVVAGGYPNDYRKGDVIVGYDSIKEATIFHAGTKLDNNLVLTNGGRVMALTGMSNTLEKAIQKSQKAAQDVLFDGKYYRKDIGLDVLRY
ncbi:MULTISPECIES: phosphoribosylamine--glycine ligase [unclassified Arcicella]|uniref:phosphoribosylamine--glycine ligase n=1 Tax=unclassified Arcicella TaxID=2644986 RepID=UPI002865EAAE|nr:MULTISPECIES: phosphoribosylamine--glycine ligase [unclassified Arcicella]MDR6563399.1 phosphoribosylamine--glycine ligase [Arcicella sp. BE51]MDR6813180.1 phosphoribosylamine--glycine ligase [Arcicella sp. BE140]MDR6824494.1 phosphoribosylamine--glycine ligase [Arcicella sp. BE139]